MIWSLGGGGAKAKVEVEAAEETTVKPRRGGEEREFGVLSFSAPRCCYCYCCCCSLASSQFGSRSPNFCFLNLIFSLPRASEKERVRAFFFFFRPEKGKKTKIDHGRKKSLSVFFSREAEPIPPRNDPLQSRDPDGNAQLPLDERGERRGVRARERGRREPSTSRGGDGRRGARSSSGS